MHIHKEFFRYVIPSMLAFALSGVYAIADGFLWATLWGITRWPPLISLIPSPLLYRLLGQD